MRRGAAFWGLVLAGAALVSSGATAKSLAFVVGIDRYDNLPAARQLKKAVNDARAMSEAFRKLNFEAGPPGEDLSRADFLKSWRRFTARVAPGDVVAFFFSGHGVEIDGNNYLILRDAPRLAPGQDQDLIDASVKLQDLRDDLDSRGARVRLFILDACRDNPFRLGERSSSAARGLARIREVEGEFIMYSAGAKATALDRLSDSDLTPTSVFTRNLAPMIQTHGLPLQKLARAVREAVSALALTAKPPHKQIPAYYDGLSADFCLAGGC